MEDIDGFSMDSLKAHARILGGVDFLGFGYAKLEILESCRRDPMGVISLSRLGSVSVLNQDELMTGFDYKFFTLRVTPPAPSCAKRWHNR